jgi:hypothetical protein
MSQIENGMKEMILKKNNPAPYEGVLVPSSRYKTYQQELDICAFEEKNPPSPVIKKSYSDMFLWGFVGLVGGYAIGLSK